MRDKYEEAVDFIVHAVANLFFGKEPHSVAELEVSKAWVETSGLMSTIYGLDTRDRIEREDSPRTMDYEHNP